MATATTIQTAMPQHWVAVRAEPPGHFTVQVVGMPDLRATAVTKVQALEQIRAMIGEWLQSGKLVAMEVPTMNPLLNFSGHLDPNDSLEQEFLRELDRQHREDLERTVREDDQECSSSSSTPTT